MKKHINDYLSVYISGFILITLVILLIIQRLEDDTTISEFSFEMSLSESLEDQAFQKKIGEKIIFAETWTRIDFGEPIGPDREFNCHSNESSLLLDFINPRKDTLSNMLDSTGFINPGDTYIYVWSSKESLFNFNLVKK